MSDYVEPAEDLGEAWLRTLELVHARGGRRVNVLTTISDPLALEESAVRAAIDAVLVPGPHKSGTIHSVQTVASTIFPQDLYQAPSVAWDPALPDEQKQRLDEAADDLYAAYGDMLPLLRTADGNNRGTYFGRMVSWPGKEAGGYNQLADRVTYLRNVRSAGRRTHNLSDIAVGGEAEPPEDHPPALRDAGVQVYAPTDRRQRGFPCLVHIDLTLLDGRLSMLAVYRHQYLVTKAYGNLVGLARLLAFLAQQTGFEVGELAVQATMADTQQSDFGGRKGIKALIDSARSKGG
ncbi:hypothetical protein OG762_22000 [Streptomyces sp. NBC_01136]|uniref:hypothetical protein n=1 Tax=unclassified Streptomyces TaxID=2593676 RepID=UPI003250FC6D|nr:hypothetical protein OG762_22000 [Streptomyces sp. NBC_01136]